MYAAILNATFEAAYSTNLGLLWSLSIAVVIASRRRLATGTVSADRPCSGRVSASAMARCIVGIIVSGIAVVCSVISTIVTGTVCSAVCASSHCWPVVLSNARPKDPDHDNRQQSEESLEKSTINLPACPLANMFADNVVEDLSKSPHKRCCGKVKEWSSLTEHSQNEDGFEDEEGDEEDQGYKLVQNVKRDVSVSRPFPTIIPVASPREASVEANISSTDQQGGSRQGD